MKIILSQIAKCKITHMIMAVESEIGAMISGYITTDNNVYVQDVYMTKQTVSNSDIDFDQDSCNMAVLKAMENDETLIGWVHSHANMGVFWSGTDVNTINKLIGFTNNFLCSIVGNRKMEIKGRVDYISTSVFGTRQETLDDLKIEVEMDYPEDIKSAFQADIDTFVAKRVYTPRQIVNYKNQSSYWSGGRRHFMTDAEIGDKSLQTTLVESDDDDIIGEVSTLTDEELTDLVTGSTIEQMMKIYGYSKDEALEAMRG